MEVVRQYSITDVNTIRVKSVLSQINVIASTSTDIVLKWTDTKRRKTEVILDNGMLTVKDRAEAALYGIVGLVWLKEDNELTLAIPSEFFGSIQLTSKDECIRAIGLRFNGLLQAKSLIGEIEVSASEIGQGDFRNGSGKIFLHSITCGQSIAATTETGNIECSCLGGAKQYLLDCHSEHGVCDLPAFSGQGAKQLRFRSKSGSITVAFNEQNIGGLNDE